MVQINIKTKNPLTFSRLMRLGQVSHTQGDSRAAHNYWRQAAMLEPDNEQVWIALMWVIDDDEDQKVCLKNILTINPNNLHAQQMLDELIGDTQPQQEARIVADVQPDRHVTLSVARVVLLGTIFGVGIAIIIVLLQMLLV